MLKYFPLFVIRDKIRYFKNFISAWLNNFNDNQYLKIIYDSAKREN